MRPFPNFTPSNANASGTIDTKGVNKDEQLVIYNDTVFSIKLTFPDTNVDIIPPSWAKDWIVTSIPMGKVKWEIVDQIQGTNYPITQIYGTLYEPTEHVARVNTSMSRSPAVTSTASGDPLFTSTFRVFSNVGTYQGLNIFNPANSGFTYTIHSAKVLNNKDNTNPICRLFLITGADNNLPIPIRAASHDGNSNPRISSSHVTANDGIATGGVLPELDGYNIPIGIPIDFLTFPDVTTLAPGNNLLIEFISGGLGNLYDLTFKWSERSITSQAPAFVAVGALIQAIATKLQNDGNVPGTVIIESQALGSSSSDVLLTNDGQLTISGLFRALADILVSGHVVEPNNTAYRMKDTTGTSRDIIALDTSDNLILHTGKAAGQFNVKQLGGAELIIIDNNEVTLDLGKITSDGAGALTVLKLLLTSGSLTRVSFFDASGTTVSSNFAHGLGVLPDIVLGINDGTNSTANPLKWSKANSDVTNAALVATVNGTFHCLAIKF